MILFSQLDRSEAKSHLVSLQSHVIWHILRHMPDAKSRTVSLFRNGRSQAIRIPKEFEFDAEQAIITQSDDGISLTLTPDSKVKKETLAEMFESWAKEDDHDGSLEFPDIDEGLLPLDDINFDSVSTK